MNTIIVINPVSENIFLKEGENLTYIAIFKNPTAEQRKLDFNFTQENTKLTFLSFIIGENFDTLNLETNSVHNAQNTTAHYFLNAIQSGKSTVNYTGNLKISKNAQKTDSYLSHKTLLLSDDAKTTTIPSLEIQADDVKAGHSATISSLDLEQLFYLKSKGLSEEESKHMLMEGFIKELLEKIIDTNAKEQVTLSL